MLSADGEVDSDQQRRRAEIDGERHRQFSKYQYVPSNVRQQSTLKVEVAQDMQASSPEFNFLSGWKEQV